jgi:hypothetical protein
MSSFCCKKINCDINVCENETIACKKAKSIYHEAKSFFTEKKFIGDNVGFEILMGPPYINCEVLFIGYQPGDWILSIDEARKKGYEKFWVTDSSQYAFEEWLLARRLRAIYGHNNLGLLEQSVGLNAIYIRARNADAYRGMFDAEQRKLIKSFCNSKNEEIIKAISPKKIVAIGFSAMDQFAPNGTIVLRGEDGRALNKVSSYQGIEVLGVRHLSGARFTTNDFELTSEKIRSFLGLNGPNKS